MRTISRLLITIAVLGAGPALGGAAAGARETQAPSPPEIDVLDAGSEPREALRLAPVVGTSERTEMTMRLDVEQSGISDASVEAPPIRATLAAALPDVAPNGDLHVTFSFPSFDVLKRKGTSAAERGAILRKLESLEALAGELTLTTQGALVDSKLDIPENVDPTTAQLLIQLRSQLRDLTVPMPQEEVGVGARWRAASQLTLSGIEARQVYEYRLKKRTGTTLQLDVRGTQTARRQTVDSGGVRLRVKRYKLAIRGTVTTDLTHLFPVAFRVRTNGDQIFDVRVRDESGELRQHINIAVTLKPA
jgi:hypothetical protein